MGTLVLWLIAIPIFSAVWDHATWDRRCDEWEKKHPGATYIRGYRKFERQSKRARKLGGEV